MFHFLSLMHDTFTLNSDIMTPFFTVDKMKNQRDSQSSDDPNGTRAHISRLLNKQSSTLKLKLFAMALSKKPTEVTILAPQI